MRAVCVAGTGGNAKCVPFVWPVQGVTQSVLQINPYFVQGVPKFTVQLWVCGVVGCDVWCVVWCSVMCGVLCCGVMCGLMCCAV